MDKSVHGSYSTLRYRFHVRDLIWFTKMIKPGMILSVKRVLYDNSPQMTEIATPVKVVYVSRYVTVVDEPVIVKRCGVKTRIGRRTSYTNAELMIWNMERAK